MGGSDNQRTAKDCLAELERLLSEAKNGIDMWDAGYYFGLKKAIWVVRVTAETPAAEWPVCPACGRRHECARGLPLPTDTRPAALPPCICLMPFSTEPGRHHSLKCPRNTENGKAAL